MSQTYARTGYLGFLRRTEAIGCDGGRERTGGERTGGERIVINCLEYHDAVFVVGALDETLILRGMRYHPIDIENSVLRAHKKIAEWSVLGLSLDRPDSYFVLSSAVFTWTNLLVVVAELDGNENEALDLVPLVTNVVLEVSRTDINHFCV